MEAIAQRLPGNGLSGLEPEDLRAATTELFSVCLDVPTSDAKLACGECQLQPLCRIL